MDFEKLAEIIPKLSSTWTVEDTQKWLQFTGLQILSQKFKTIGIDGSCLHSLSEDDLRDELGVSSKIMVKKIMAWVQPGFNNFDEHLRFSTKLNSTMKSILPLPKLPYLQADHQIELPESDLKRESTHNDLKQKNQENQLIIKQCQVPHTNYYSFKSKGGTLGRNTTNQISISDQFVSRFHAQIIFQNNQYFIKDCGSSTGTFLRITEKINIDNGIILEMGGNQFQVNITDKLLMALKVIEGPNIGHCYVVPKKDKITIGRKPHNQINFPEDTHLSNIHSTLFNVNGTWYVEDLGSTNGTWIRLSPQGVKSSKWKLQDKSQFKLGTSLTYECRRNTENRKTEKQRISQQCIACKQAQRDAIILPCKHNTYCYECINKLAMKQCTTCNANIINVIKFFKV